MILYLTYINFSNGDSTCIKLSFLFFQNMNCYQNKTLVFFISAAGMAYFLVMNLFGGDAEPKTSSLPRSEATGNKYITRNSAYKGDNLTGISSK